MRKARVIQRIDRERMARRLLVLVLMTIVSVLSGCSTGEDSLPCDLDPLCLRYLIAADIPILDPHRADSIQAGMIFSQIYDSLVRRDAESHGFLPGLATEWQVSADGLDYTFHLRRDARFHDGSKFDASAVAYNIERIFDPARANAYTRELLGPLAEYEILDDYTIRLTLAAPYAAFLDSLAQPFLGIASPAALGNYSELRHQFYLSGTGPFRLAQYLPGERAVLHRFDGYWDLTDSIDATTSALRRVEFVFTRADPSDAIASIGASFDIIDDISPAAAQNLVGNSHVSVLPTAVAGMSVQFLFNTGREHVEQRDVRLALLLATNRVAIIDQVFFGFSTVAWSPLSTNTGFAHTGYINAYELDLPSAQALLTSAGYMDTDGDGILERGGLPLSLRIVVPPWDRLPDVARQLQAQWRAVGVELTIEPVPGRTTLTDLIRSGEYDLVPVEQFGIDPQTLNRVFLNGARYSASRRPEPSLNNLIVNATQETDYERRRALIYEIQKQIMDEVLILPVREPLRLTAARADLRGLRFDAYGLYPLLRLVQAN